MKREFKWLSKPLLKIVSSRTVGLGCLFEAALHFKVHKNRLMARFNSRQSKKEAHKHEKTLNFAEESALVDWVCKMGCQGIPFHALAVAQHASVISGHTIGKSWVHRFKTHHPKLKMKCSTGLEKCHAQSLNEATVSVFYDLLDELVTQYNVPAENIYNMDEKGVQLGMWKCVQ